MEALRNLLIRFRHSGVLLFIGFILIIYVAFGFVYWQQGLKQKGLEEQVAKLSLIVNKPLASKEELKEEYDKVNDALAPMEDEDAIAMLVGIAEESGINVAPDSDKLIVPSVKEEDVQVGGGTYQVFSFKSLSVQGSYENVMAFISNLDSGTTRKTLVLKRVDIRQVEVQDESGERTWIETQATLDVDLYTKP